MTNISIISFSEKGSRLNKMLLDSLKNKGYSVKAFSFGKHAIEFGLIKADSLDLWTKDAFNTCDILLFIGACGIAVRAIAPHIKDKFNDPAVLVMDEKAKYVIPILSGHIGGANEFAVVLSEITKGIPVITTATDINNKFAVDIFAKKNGLFILEKEMIKVISSKMLEETDVAFLCDNLKESRKLPAQLTEKTDGDTCICVSIYQKNLDFKNILHLIPKKVHIGVGCKKGTDKDRLSGFIDGCLAENKIFIQSVSAVCTIDIKKEEKGIIDFAKEKKIPLKFYSAEELNSVEGIFSSSKFVKSITNTDNVCERAAAACGGRLIVRKISSDGMTFAAACENWSVDFE